ncbi:MAG: response regulator [Magnetococcales bacterium]|nr:response regulator [Magnetococcales bacterium]
MKDILIVDDEQRLVNLLCRVLQDAGYTLATASNGVEALQVYQAVQPRLVISDIIMPDMDGIDLIQHIQSIHQEQKIIAMSGGNAQLAMDFVLKLTRMFGVVHVLQKPFTNRKILDAVALAIGLPDPSTHLERDSMNHHPQSEATRSILIIDDNPAIRTLMTRILRESGYAVEAASNGREGVQAFQRSPADLVITDIIMPEMDGIEVVMQFARLENRPRIIAISGGSPPYLSAALNLKAATVLGATSILMKPFTASELTAAVARAFGTGESDAT